MDETETDLTIRPARPDDRAFVLAALPRLAEFGPPPWRPPAELAAGEARTAEAFFTAAAPGAVMLVAERSGGERAGFVYLERVRDYFTGEEHGHVGIIVVAAGADGRGVGGALMRAAETWARDAGFRRLTLTVFAGNRRAREVYEHLGYRAETLRYVKLLG